jgi:hypothetical protein
LASTRIYDQTTLYGTGPIENCSKISNAGDDVEKEVLEMLKKPRESDVQKYFVPAQNKYKDSLNKYKEPTEKFD